MLNLQAKMSNVDCCRLASAIVVACLAVGAFSIDPSFNANQTLELETFCDVRDSTVNYSVTCLIQKGDVFSFQNFRRWSKEKQNTSIWLHLNCENGGVVKLSWPFSSYHLVSLIVNGCLVEDLLVNHAESDTPTATNDRLETVKLVHSTFKIDGMKLQAISKKLETLSSDHECGPRNVKTYVWRNVSAILSTNARQGYRRLQSCEYPNTLVYENSYTSRKPCFELQMLTGISHFYNLKVLNLTRANYVKISREVSDWRLLSPKLETLDLSFNFVSSFDFTDYTKYNEPLPVGYINMQYNNISFLNNPELKSLVQLNTTLIDVRHNPFNCECNIITTFNEFLRRHNGPLEGGLQQDYSYLWKLECKYPPRFAGRVISELTSAAICDSDVSGYVIPIVILPIVIIILTIMVIVITKYRKDIRILVFTRLNIVLPCQPIDGDTNKQFDAFISYCSADAEWVIKTLLPGLEASDTGLNFKLCLRDRDCPAGGSTGEQIISSVENSRHTVLVVSGLYLKSEWCVLEFRTALNQSMLEKRCHMIIILLQHIDLTDVEPDFRRCMQSMTYIEADDKLFWDRIRYALARRSTNKRVTINEAELQHVPSKDNLSTRPGSEIELTSHLNVF